jgi:low temperature requirement protein LtrA
MSSHATPESVAAWRRPMTGRDPAEPHRAATPLELFFDLVFVVAVAQAALGLHHELAEGHVLDGLGKYLLVFFTIWWPWVNFTWFASAYDTDDVPYRFLVFLQMVGVLIVAAGIPRVFEALDFTVAVFGYVLMRLALVAQWLRAASGDPEGQPVAYRYAIGIMLVQVAWIARLAVGGGIGVVLLIVLGIVEMLIPAWAERAGRQTPWHPGHIAERYGLFTIIVLGECVLATMAAVQVAITAGGASPALGAVAAGGLLLVFSLWWAYFKRPTEIDHRQPLRRQLAWGYGHYVIFASIAALGAGLQVAIEAIADPEHVDARVAILAVAVPSVVVLLALGALHDPSRRLAAVLREVLLMAIVAAIGLAAGSLSVPLGVLATGLAVAAIVAWHLWLIGPQPPNGHAPAR